MDHPQGVIHLSWLRGQDLVTFCDPETSRLKTSFHRKVSLRTATTAVLTYDLTGRSFNQPHNQEKSPTKVGLFSWLRGQDLNLRPVGYEPTELTGLLHPAIRLLL